MKIKSQIILATLLVSLTTSSYADFGIGVEAYNHLPGYKNLNKEMVLIPRLEYRGNKFNIDKTKFSYSFTNSNKLAVEALLTSKHYGYRPKDSKTFAGMDDRAVSIDLGGRIIMDTRVGNLVFDITRDVNVLKKGFDAELKLGGIAPHAPHWTGKKSFKALAAIGVRYQNKDVADYYYGVKTSEATANRPAYKAKAATTLYVGVDAQANINKHFSIEGKLKLSKEANSIKNSPLTEDKEYQPMVNIGLSYWF